MSLIHTPMAWQIAFLIAGAVDVFIASPPPFAEYAKNESGPSTLKGAISGMSDAVAIR